MSFSIYTEGTGAQQKITLSDSHTGAVAEIFALGALLNAFRVQTKAGVLNVVDGFADPNEAGIHITDAFKSAKMSPFACRLHHGRYRFDNKEWKLGSFYLGEHALHGFLYNAVYEIKNTIADESSASVELEHRYTGNIEGFPFAYSLTVVWKLSANHHLSVSTTAINHSAFVIPFSDGWHPYFTTGSPIDECELKFNSDRKLDFNEDLIPTGKEEKDDRFINGSSLRNINLDNSFILPLHEKGVCELKSKQVRILVEPELNYPYLQVYIPAHRQSMAIENLSAAPDAFNNGMGLIHLRPNDPVSFVTNYRVEVL